jgi:hypothetical protein
MFIVSFLFCPCTPRMALYSWPAESVRTTNGQMNTGPYPGRGLSAE